MLELNTSLLREKFIIHDVNADISSDERALQALSNRLVIELKNNKGDLQETFVIRAQNMHSCVRMAARIIKTYETAGPIMNRAKEYDWEAAWDLIVNDYEHRFNPDRWVAIYNNGRCVFKSGEHHLFLDVIEKCDARNKNAYEKAIPMAEEAFKQAGKIVRIEHDSNVALVISLERMQGRFGVIMRGPTRTTTFNFSVTARGKEPLNMAQCLAASACFLEGIQVAFLVGMNSEKIRLGIIKRFSEEEKQTKAASSRLSRMNSEIANLEGAYEVHYRPERPEFQHIVMDAEKLAQKVLVPPSDDDEEFLDDEPPENEDDGEN